jgi:hypothetical protein
MPTTDLPETIHPADVTSMQVIRDSAAFKTRPIDELLDLAYEFGRARGKLEGVEQTSRAIDAVFAQPAPPLLEALSGVMSKTEPV